MRIATPSTELLLSFNVPWFGVADHQDPSATAAIEPSDHEVAEPLLVAGGFVPHPLDGPPTALEPRLARSAMAFTPSGV